MKNNALCLSANPQSGGSMCLVRGAIVALWDISYSEEEKRGLGQISKYMLPISNEYPYVQAQ